MAAVLEKSGHDVYCSDLIDYQKLVPGSPEIFAPLDFLKTDVATFKPCLMPKAIVTNPPFTLSAAFVDHGLRFCDEVYILNRLAFLEGRARGKLLNDNLTDVWVFENRPPMLHRWSQNDAGAWVEWQGTKSDSAMALAWFRFSNFKDGHTRLRRIRWRREDNTL
jgi:hypothetical protein